MHTLSGPLTGRENYQASLETFQAAGSDNQKLGPAPRGGAFTWRQKHYYKRIHSSAGVIWRLWGANQVSIWGEFIRSALSGPPTPVFTL